MIIGNMVIFRNHRAHWLCTRDKPDITEINILDTNIANIVIGISFTFLKVLDICYRIFHIKHKPVCFDGNCTGVICKGCNNL